MWSGVYRVGDSVVRCVSLWYVPLWYVPVLCVDCCRCWAVLCVSTCVMYLYCVWTVADAGQFCVYLPVVCTCTVCGLLQILGSFVCIYLCDVPVLCVDCCRCWAVLCVSTCGMYLYCVWTVADAAQFCVYLPV